MDSWKPGRPTAAASAPRPRSTCSVSTADARLNRPWTISTTRHGPSHRTAPRTMTSRPWSSRRNADRPSPSLGAPLEGGGLAGTLLDLDAEGVGTEAIFALKDVEQALAEVAGEQLGRGVLDRQQDAVVSGEEPFAVAVADMDAPRRGLDADQGVARRQQHAVVQFVGQSASVALQGD